MNTAIAASTTPAGLGQPRTCSGACPFFRVRSDEGRKIPGTGQCVYQGAVRSTEVGTACAWKLGRFGRRLPLDPSER
jgi:hypothetical protein